VRNRSRITIVSLLTFTLSAATAFAQTDNWKIDIAGGAAPTVGATSDRLTAGWNFDAGAEREIANGVGLRGDFGYYGLSVSDQVLQMLQVPGGDARMFSLTVGPVWHFPISSRVNAYALAGIGWYRRTVEFGQPTVAVIDRDPLRRDRGR
jgi:hypothetical protein